MSIVLWFELFLGNLLEIRSNNCWPFGLRACLALLGALCCAVRLSAQASRGGQTKAASNQNQVSRQAQVAQLLQEGRLDEAENTARAGISAEPRNAESHALLGVVLSHRGKQDEAERELRTALRLSPRSVQ